MSVNEPSACLRITSRSNRCRVVQTASLWLATLRWLAKKSTTDSYSWAGLQACRPMVTVVSWSISSQPYSLPLAFSQARTSLALLASSGALASTSGRPAQPA